MRIRRLLPAALLLLACAAVAGPLALAQDPDGMVGAPECSIKAKLPRPTSNTGITARGSASSCTHPVTVRLRVCLELRRDNEGAYKALTCKTRKRRLSPGDGKFVVTTKRRSCAANSPFRAAVRARVGTSDPVTRHTRGREFCKVA